VKDDGIWINKLFRNLLVLPKGRHEDCMKEIPVDGRSDGPHDCTFDTKLIPCKCKH